MKGKHIGKKIIASVLMLAMICSNISVYAENQAEQVETEAQENIESIAEEAPSEEDTATLVSQEEEQEPEVTIEDSEASEEDTTQEPSAPSEPSDAEETPTTTEPEAPSEPVTPPSEEAPSEEQQPSVETPTEEQKPEDNQQPETPAEPEEPTQPVEPETPAEPENPTQPAQPEEPTQPVKPEEPTQPETPAVTEEDTGNEGDTAQPPETSDEATDANTAPTENTTPEEAEPEEDEEPIDFDGLLSLEELTALDDETVDATMWENQAATFGMRRSRSRMMRYWSFDTYYVNQDGRYDVTKTNNFNLKYQMEFHASKDLEAGKVQIKIPYVLFKDRDGQDITPNDIAVPQGEMEWTEEGKLDPDAYTTNRNTPFNYYVEGEYLVFFNYRTIPSGTNAAWQVLYKNLRLMNIKDETPWTLTPEIKVEEGDFEETTALTGKVDSSVSLTSVLKTPYQDTALNYTPGLYTASQVERYIKGSLPEKYADENGRLNTSEYRFVVWDVKLRGNATQPWDLFIDDNPTATTAEGKSVTGEVVGYRDNSNRSTSYGLAIKEPNVTDPNVDKTASSTNQKEESWGSRFYVVTAYPADVEEGDLVQNDLTIRLHPYDNQDDNVSLKASTAGWEYENYDWTYSGNVIGIKKETDETVYTGWLDAYAKASFQGKDYGEMPFTTNGYMNGYAATHEITGENIGRYIPGSYYNMTTADDVIYLHPTAGEIEGTMLDGDDYYFSSVTIEQADYGYDIWEDKMVASELAEIQEEGSLPKDFDPSVRIYAMCSNLPENNDLETDKDGWTLITTKELDESGRMEPYELEEEYIDWQPWRIKVEHNSIDYRSTCQIDVNVCLKSNSPKMQTIIANRPETKDEKKSSVRIENLSGSMAVAYKDGSEPNNYPSDVDSQYNRYEGLQEETKKIYNNNLLVRDNAYRDVTWLTMTAASFKESKSSNDVDNNRGLVEYMLTAYDGYEIYDRNCLDYLSEGDQKLISPGRNYVVFYDLLPYGMNFDASFPVTAGRITNLDKNGDYKRQPRAWDTTQVKVSVDSNEIDTNYRGTGRTLIPFRITFEGADATSYTNQKWIEGWGVHFRAYYDWKDMGAINRNQINSNISAFMPDFSENTGGSNDEKPALCGLKTEVYLDNGVIEDKGLQAACADLIKDGGNIDGINKTDKDDKPFDTTYRNVLYANNVLMDDIAVSSQATIEKLVRADADRLGTFSESTIVPVGEPYTYSITVTARRPQTNIVVYDRLENAAEDRKEIENEPFAPFNENPWQGAFQSVDISALEKQGIHPVIYYNANQDATITTGKQAPGEVLTEANGWYTEGDFIKYVKRLESDGQKHLWTEYVKAVAVDLGAYTLPQNQSISFQIKMKAPESKPEDCGDYAYNNTSFYAVPMIWNSGRFGEYQPDAAETVSSSSVRVGLDQKEHLEIIKKVSGDVPSAREDESFTFQVYEEYTFHTELSKHPLAFTEYKLYRIGEQGDWEEQQGQVYATDGNGYLYLKNNEKAVFQMADVSRIKVRETENVFWESKVSDNTEGEDASAVRTLTFTNTFRPVLYVQKKLAGVPEGVNLNESDNIFIFKLESKDNKGDYRPVADAEFWYVDSARLDGSIPNKLKTGRTDAAGEFSLRPSEIIALFPGFTGTEYQLTETDSGENWLCTDKVSNGTLRAEGNSKIFTNYYKWKNLQIIKQITHQSQEDYDIQADELKTFTFRVVESPTNEDGSPMLGPNGEAITVKKPSAGEGSPQVEATAGLTWVLLDAEGKEIGTEADGTKGTLDNNGEFRCALGFRTVRIKGLEADKTYLVTEVADGIPKEPGSDKPLYQAVNDIVEIKMPIFSGKKEAEFTNDYQKRSLSVSKTLVTEQTEAGEIPGGGQEILSLLDSQMSSDIEGGIENVETADMQSNIMQARLSIDGLGNASSEEGRDKNMAGDMGGDSAEKPEVVFTFYLKINGEPKANYPYTVTKQGVVVRDNLTTGADGSFTLSDKETAVFEAVGMLGDSFEVSEEPNKDYNQIYPADEAAHTGIFAGEGAAVSFVNGAEGSLYLSKEYVTADENDEASTQYVADLKEAVAASEIQDENTADFQIGGSFDSDDKLLEDSAVEFILEVTEANGTSYIWPKESTADGVNEVSVSYINQFTGVSYIVKWRAGQPIKMYPWYMIAIPEGEGGIPKGATYTLREAEDDQHRIINYIPRRDTNIDVDGPVRAAEDVSQQVLDYSVDSNMTKVRGIVNGGLNGGDTVIGLRRNQDLQLSQSYPEDDQAIVGTVAEKPIATIYNEVKNIECMSSANKCMTSSSSDVPTGAKLVWRLEQFVGENAQSGIWMPASGIPYIVRAVEGKTPDSQSTIGKPISDRIEATGEDGRIILYKTDDGYPLVQFTENQVYLNLYSQEDIEELLYERSGGVMSRNARAIDYGEEDATPLQGPLLRLVEVTEESDAEWGTLAGYTSYNLGTGKLEYGMNAGYGDAIGFVNANKMEPVEIEKRMSVQSDQQFTMILKQVISVRGDIRNLIEKGPEGLGGTYDVWIAVLKRCIVETQPRGNIPYTIHNADGSVAGEAVTGANGEIKLYAGQYATLNLPEESLWTVEEDLNVTPTYSLENLEANPDAGRMIKLDENLMLISKKGPDPVGYTVEYYVFDGSADWALKHTEPRTGYAGETVSVTYNDKYYNSDELLFMEGDERNILSAELKEDNSTTLKLYFTINKQVSYMVQRWYKKTGGDESIHTVNRKGATIGTIVYASDSDKEYSSASDKTVVYYLDETDDRNKQGLLVTDNAANNVLNLYYNRYYTVTYTDGVEGETVFPDQGQEKLKEGDKTPLFVGTPTREGYEFMGWSPAVQETVTGDVTYEATWQKVGQ